MEELGRTSLNTATMRLVITAPRRNSGQAASRTRRAAWSTRIMNHRACGKSFRRSVRLLRFLPEGLRWKVCLPVRINETTELDAACVLFESLLPEHRRCGCWRGEVQIAPSSSPDAYPTRCCLFCCVDCLLRSWDKSCFGVN